MNPSLSKNNLDNCRKNCRVGSIISSGLSSILRKGGVKIISVSGAHSGVGKTKFIESLLKILKGWSVLKVTVSRNGSCPTEKDCGVCADLKSGFSILTEKNVMEETGKDTQRFKIAGAKEVIWLRAKPKGLKQGLKKAMHKFKNTTGLLVEGTSVLKHINPDLSIFIKNKNSVLKPSAKEILKKVDLILTM